VYGMLDASGGVWNWTSSWDDAREIAKVLRGGSWSSPVDELRCAIRISNPLDVRRPNIGFRCARSLRDLGSD
jgi:formylglycine-generating enzyme required for sulfatase activity